MKIVRRMLALLTLSVMILSTSVPQVSVAASRDAALRDTIGLLFTSRAEQALGRDSGLERFYEAGSAIGRHEDGRPAKFRELERRWNTPIVSMKSTPSIRRISRSGNTAEVSVYEWTFFDWLLDGRVITSGFGVEHEMTWGLENNRWVVLDDSYDEGPLTGVKSPKYKTKGQVTPQPGAIISGTTVGIPQSDITPLWYAYYPYDRNAAANYADTYVYRQAAGGIYEQYYNNDYYINYNGPPGADWGGDCANYVSQSMHAGGAPFVNMGTDNSASWWYDDKGTYPKQTGDDTSSESWRYVPTHKLYMVPRWGVSTQGSSLQKGDIVYYDWQSDGVWDHVTIVVVSAASNGGVALVDSHNNDYYHVRWNYGYSDTAYHPVSILDQLPVWFN